MWGLRAKMGFTTVYESNHHKFLDTEQRYWRCGPIWDICSGVTRHWKVGLSFLIKNNWSVSTYLSIDISELPPKGVIASSEVSANKMRRYGLLPGSMKSVSPFHLASSQCLHISISFILCSTWKHHLTFLIFVIIYLRSQLLCLMHFEYGCRKDRTRDLSILWGL